MYKYKVRFKCGHEKEYEVDYKPDSAVKEIDSECEKCRAKINSRILTIAELDKLSTPFTGTEKQVAAATKNRERFISQWVKTASDSQSDIIRDIIKNETYAGWWMDHYKEVFSNEFVNDYYRKYKSDKKRKRKSGSSVKKETLPDTKKQEIIRHMIKPAGAGNVLIFIELVDNTMRAVHSSLDDNLMNIMVENGMSYLQDKDIFIKDINEYTGNYSDRAAELGISLLNAGYSVSVLNNTIINMIKTGRYIPQNDKWVKSFNSQSVYLDWKGYERVLCNRALSFIENAHWDNNFKKVIVPVTSYRQLEDYAHRYGFNIDNKALKMLEQAKRRAL